MFIKYKMQSLREAKKNNAILLNGKNIEGTTNNRLGYHDQTFARAQFPFGQLLWYDLSGYKIVVNPTRNQNYRKYFEMHHHLILHFMHTFKKRLSPQWSG